MSGPDVRPDAADLPRRDRATLSAGRATVTPVTRELATRIVRGFYPDWDLWTLGCLYVAAPKGADPLADVAVVNADTVAELIQKIGETARSAR